MSVFFLFSSFFFPASTKKSDPTTTLSQQFVSYTQQYNNTPHPIPKKPILTFSITLSTTLIKLAKLKSFDFDKLSVEKRCWHGLSVGMFHFTSFFFSLFAMFSPIRFRNTLFFKKILLSAVYWKNSKQKNPPHKNTLHARAIDITSHHGNLFAPLAANPRQRSGFWQLAHGCQSDSPAAAAA